MGKKNPKFEKYTGFKPHLIHCTAHVIIKMKCGLAIVLVKF